MLCLLLFVIQITINGIFQAAKYKCGCECVPYPNNTVGCEQKCGVEYSTETQAESCAIEDPTLWPAFLQVPAPQYRAVGDVNSGFPATSCRNDGSCPVSFLYTGQNRSFAQGMAPFLFEDSNDNLSINSSLSNLILGTSTWTFSSNIIEPAVLSPQDAYILRQNCTSSRVPVSLPLVSVSDIACAEADLVWKESYSSINDFLYAGFENGNPNKDINEISGVYDFGSTSAKNFDLTIAFNATYKNDTDQSPPGLVRIPRSMNLAAQAFLRVLQGPNAELPLWFVSDMPKGETTLKLDFASLIGPLFFMWVIQLLLPVILTSLVYEKQYNLRIMMKMHGLKDGPYWLISYCYFLALSILYMVCFIVFGSLIGLKFFTLNSYSIQTLFYFIYINLQIAFGFLLSTRFSNVKTATVVGYIIVFGFGLVGNFLFGSFLEDQSFSKVGLLAMELIPAFALYRGLYEFSQYAFIGNYKGSSGMRWSNLSDPKNGLKQAMTILAIEWLLFLLLAYYLDQVVVSGSGLKKNCLFFLNRNNSSLKKESQRRSSFKIAGSEVNIELQKEDVLQERETVEKALSRSGPPPTILCDDIRKVYAGRDGNAPRYAVKGLSLAIPRGECFGMLGPNGSGKTTSINIMTGLLAPTSGTVTIEGMDIRKDLNKIYSCMGVCPQHDLLWGTLTGREHLLFYGRLKNLKGSALKNAIDASLRKANLFYGGVGDKQARKYSGGMKRRLSVAISLIGNPKVVYMDEPSTGLDPASRSNLWGVVKEAKRDKAIILTTHSMEEAETLCDRIGILVDGELQCIGNSKELKSRYGGSYVFSITTDPREEGAVMDMVQELSPNAKRVYNLSGTQKFELPKSDVRIASVFRMVEHAKTKFSIQAWGFADTTLEDVFIKVARDSKNDDDSLP